MTFSVSPQQQSPLLAALSCLMLQGCRCMKGFMQQEVSKSLVCHWLQGSMLDKHKLALQLSTRKVSSAVKSNKEANPEKQSTKLVVRNVAFEATRKDVMSLFSPFGHMKSCRLPRKFDGTPRCVCVCASASCMVYFGVFYAWLCWLQYTEDCCFEPAQSTQARCVMGLSCLNWSCC